MNILIEISTIFFGIILVTFLQKYHYKMLNFLMKNSHFFMKKIFQFFIRFWVIIHEICHLIFWILSWSKVKNISLFSKTWGSVSFETKNYIWALGQHYDKPGFIFALFLNQIGIFLTSIWPLIFWIVVTIFLQNYLEIPLEINKIPDFLLALNIKEILILLLYFLLIPSFILSFQDIKHFIISHQSSLGATIIASGINIIIFVLFLWFLTIFFEFFSLFFIFYICIFCILFILFWIIKIFSQCKKWKKLL